MVKFGETETEKYKFHKGKHFLCMKFFWINILNILLITKKMVKRTRPFYVMLPKMSACRRDFDETKYKKIDELLEK